MFNIERSYKISCLIWIQLIVLFLLLALFFFFAVVPLDSDHDSAAAAAATFLPSAASTPFFFDEIQQIHDSTPTLRQLTQDTQNQNLIKSEVLTDASSSTSGEEIEGDASSLNPHPCHYFQLATVAFLKCFGLDSMSDSSNPKCRKRKES